ncbi:MAG: hypothetical protein WD379_08920 [Dehalococcoidia bacterium]
MLDGHDLPAWKRRMLRVVARKMVHAENLSNALFYEGELRQDGEPKMALAKLHDLTKEVRADLAFIFEGETDDPFADLHGR